jgi:hypothetical protein
MEAGPDTALFPNVDTETEYGWDKKVRMMLPIFTGALGSTDVTHRRGDKSLRNRLCGGCVQGRGRGGSGRVIWSDAPRLSVVAGQGLFFHPSEHTRKIVDTGTRLPIKLNNMGNKIPIQVQLW